MLELTVLESDSISANTVFRITPSGLVENNPSDPVIFANENTPGAKEPQFRIHFYQQVYYISDMGRGTGTFVKVKNKVLLRDSSIISFGDNHMVTKMKDPGIVLHFIEGIKNGEKFEASGKEKVLVGRMNDCKIRFDDQSLSRYQCMIQFEEGLGWVLYDGDGTKSSLNGTWVFADEDIEVYNDLIFKSGSSLFKVNIIN